MADLDLSPPTLNATAYAGDDRDVTVTVTTPTGTPFPLVAPFLCQVRGASADPDPAVAAFTFTSAEPSTGVGTLTIDGDSTEALLALPGATTKTWKSGGVTYTQPQWSGVWDLQMGEDSADNVLTLFTGTFTVLGDVSRETP